MRKIQVNVSGVSTSVTEDKLTKKANGDVYKHYNADMSLDMVKITAEKEKAKSESQVSTARANMDATNVAVTIDMYQLLSEDEQTAITDFRAEQLLIIKNGGSDGDVVVTPELQAAFDKLSIVTI